MHEHAHAQVLDGHNHRQVVCLRKGLLHILVGVKAAIDIEATQ